MPKHRAAIVRAVCVALLAVIGGNALSLSGGRMVGRYDFGYAIRGDRAARPAQVFDDGAGKVYFAVRPGQAMPAVFVGDEPSLLVTQPEGQYFTARTGASEFTLALGALRATVRRGDAALGAEQLSEREEPGRLLASAGPGLPAGVDFGVAGADGAGPRRLVHEQPVVFPLGSAVLRQEVRDALSALVVRIGRGVAITVEGRNDAGLNDGLARLRAEALRNALLARNVAAADLSMASASASPESQRGRASVIRWTTVAPSRDAGVPSSPARFDIEPADRDIATSLRRWAGASGYEIVWDVRWSAPVEGARHVEAASFLDAVRQVAVGLRARGYPVQAQAYGDRVVRFTAME